MPDTITAPATGAPAAPAAPDPTTTPSPTHEDGAAVARAESFDLDSYIEKSLGGLEVEDPTPVGTSVTEQTPAGTPPTRDAQGRFTAPTDGQPAAEGAPKEGETPTAVTTPTGADPFRFRFNNQTMGVEGATVDKDGNIAFPATQHRLVQQAFNALHARGITDEYIGKLQEHAAGLEAQLAQAAEGGSLAEQQAKVMVEGLEKVLLEPDEEKFFEAVVRLRAGWPQLKANAERDYWKTKAERGTTRATTKAPTDPAAPAAPAYPTQDAVREQVSAYIGDAKIDRDFRDLTPEDWTEYEARVARTPYAFHRPATPEEQQQYGVAPGEIVFDSDAWARDLAQFADGKRGARKETAGAAALAADHARRTQPSVTAPPTPGGAPAPSGTRSQRPQTEQEWDAFMDDPRQL